MGCVGREAFNYYRPGDFMHLFLDGAEKAGFQEKKQIIFSSMNGDSHGKGKNCQKEWNGEVFWLYRRGKYEGARHESRLNQTDFSC